ncbi:MAG TPA: 50S ribosomal protein L25 [Syntrophomonadaceae bacterium]|nr:50S ribosomal protein L25 [Syntrophomonadaceae bacterium]
MAKMNTINCQQRTASKAYRHKMKREAKVPGIIYSKGEANVAIACNGKTLNHLFSTQGSRGLFYLEVEGIPMPIPAVVRDLQKHAINGNIIHVDFMRVNLAVQMEAAVAVQILGEENLHDKGGILQVEAREVHISCLPESLPEYLAVDVSLLGPGDQVSASELVLPAGVNLISEPDQIILTILHEGRLPAGESAPVAESEQGK